MGAGAAAGALAILTFIGLRTNGDRVVITKDTDRQTAERIASLLTAGTFTDLFIEAGGSDGELLSVGSCYAAVREPALVAFAHG
jgi:hypothetical protein